MSATIAMLVLGASSILACGDDDDPEASATPEAPADEGGGGSTSEASTESRPTVVEETGCTTEETGPLQIVLINDDGVINPAIDVLIDHWGQHQDYELDVTVVAPADERSGSSDTTTPGGASHSETTTPGGNPAHAVDGFPADSVGVALDDLGLEPHLVVSGINPGQNFGTFAPLSGTIGAARTALRRDVPALAVSAGLVFDEAQFEVGAELAAEWIGEHCEALIAREFQTDTLASINIPACTPEQMGPLQEVPRALEMPPVPEGESIFSSTCDLADPAPADDVAAVRSGYPSLTQVEPEI